MTLESLEKLQDDELRVVIGRSHEILGDRDKKRKEKAMEEARAILLRVGLTPQDLAGKSSRGRSATVKTPSYQSGRQYQHPTNQTLTWNAKGQKPRWLRDLEAQGGKPVEAAPAVNDIAPQKRAM